MTFYFGGGEVGAWTPETSDWIESTSGTWDGNFARAAFRGKQFAAHSAAMSLPDEFWVHWESQRTDTVTDSFRPLALRAGTTDLIRVQAVKSTETVQVSALISGSFTAVTSPAPTNVLGRQVYDLHIKGNTATGTVELYVNRTKVASVTPVDLSAVVGVTNVRIEGVDGVSAHSFSQCIISDQPTTALNLGTVYPSGNGASTDWTNGYTAIDEIAYDDSDFISSGSANQVSLFTGTSVATLTGYNIKAVIVTARALCGTSGPQNLELALRPGSTTYFSASQTLNNGYDSFFAIWETNPDTSAAWAVADIASLQFGVKSIT